MSVLFVYFPISLPHCFDGQCRVLAANLRLKPRLPLCWRPSDPSRCKPRCVRLPSCGASCRLDANQYMPNCCQSPYALPPLMPCRAVSRLQAAIMVNKFFIRINSLCWFYVANLRASRAMCSFYYSTKTHKPLQRKLNNKSQTSNI